MSQGESLEFPVTAPGAKQAADDMNKVSDGMKKSAGEWDKMSSKSAKATAALGAMGNALGPLGSNFGILGQSISRATGIISSMTTLVGGPWAVAIGAAAIGIGVLAKKLSEGKDKADELRKSLVEQWQAEVEIEKQRRASDRARDAEEKRAAEQGAADFMAREIRSGRVKISKDPRDVVDDKSGGGGPKETKHATLQSSSIQLDTIDAEIAASKERQKALLDTDRIAEAEKTAMLNAEMDIRQEKDRAVFEERMAHMQEEHDKYLEQSAEREMRHNQMNAMIRGGLEDQGKLAIRAANEAAKGHAMGKKAAVQAIGDALVARGTAAIAEGGIWSSVPFMWGSGTPMIAMGLAAIGTGMAMGAASRAIPSGGGKAQSTGTPQLAPATPVALDRTGGNAGPTVINVNVPTVLSASGEDGARVANALEQAKREGRI